MYPTLHMPRIHALSVRSDLAAASFHARLSRGFRRISIRTSRVEATNDVYVSCTDSSSCVTEPLSKIDAGSCNVSH